MSRTFGVSAVSYSRNDTLGARAFASHAIGDSGEWEAEVSYAFVQDRGAAVNCVDAVSCYGTSRAVLVSVGGTLYYRFNRDWFGLASAYVSWLGGDMTLFAVLEAEFERSVTMLKRVREVDRLLDDNAVLQSAIVLRNPYVDALSLLQIALLRRKRALSEHDAERTRVDDALATTLSGIAQGLRNTG